MPNDKELVRFEMADGGSVVFETDANQADGPQRIARGGEAAEPHQAEERFESVARRIRPAAQVVLDALRELDSPREIQLEFGLKVSAKAGIVIAGTDSEVNFKVSVKWVNPA